MRHHQYVKSGESGKSKYATRHLAALDFLQSITMKVTEMEDCEFLSLSIIKISLNLLLLYSYDHVSASIMVIKNEVKIIESGMSSVQQNNQMGHDDDNDQTNASKKGELDTAEVHITARI